MFHSALVNTGQHIHSILDRTRCGAHSADKGIPCFTIVPGTTSNADLLFGVCGGRIKRAGYNGKISPTSLQLRAPGGRYHRNKSAQTT